MDLMTQDAIRFAVALWLAGMGELVVERAGVVNIGIEGIMLVGALAGWAATVATGSPWAGLAAAAGAGAATALLFAIVTLVFDADQVVTGTAINLLAGGATNLGFSLCIGAGLTSRVSRFFAPVGVTLLPVRALDQFGLCYATLILLGATHLFLRHTRAGVELVALGEYPAAADAAGIRVRRRRLWCVLWGGMTAGLAGCYLSTMLTQEFRPEMTAGRGFLALAMVIFGRWQPIGLLAGGLFFGYVYALQVRLEVAQIAWMPSAQILQMAPYVLSLLVLAGFMGRTRAPAALGQAFERT